MAQEASDVHSTGEEIKAYRDEAALPRHVLS